VDEKTCLKTTKTKPGQEFKKYLQPGLEAQKVERHCSKGPRGSEN